MKKITTLLVSIMVLLNTALAYTVTIIIDGVRLEITRDVGEVVEVTPTLEEIKGWEVKSGGVTLTNNTFTMPSQNVELEAILETINETAKYMLTVKNYGITTNGLKEAGSEVVVTAISNDKQVFTSWTVDGIELSQEQQTSATIIFTMPENAVTLTANYETETEEVTSPYTITTIQDSGAEIEGVYTNNRCSECGGTDHECEVVNIVIEAGDAEVTEV